MSLADQWESVPPHSSEIVDQEQPAPNELLVNEAHDPNSKIFDGSAQLEKIRDIARHHRVGPTALLLATLSRLSAQVAPTVMVDVGKGPGSLNLFGAIVGPSGSEKSRTLSLAGEVLHVSNPSTEYELRTPGSGEGIIGAYAPRTVFGKDKEAPTEKPGATSVLWEESEIMNLTALKGRTGSTLQGFLTKLFTAEFLNITNKDGGPTIPSGSYRACLLLGVQPGRADALLADADQGFPQRFIWVDTKDPSRMPGTDYPEAKALTVRIPQFENNIIQGCDAAKRLTYQTSDRGLIEGNYNGLDSHAMFVRAKVAALLAVLREHDSMEDDDWLRAGYLMNASSRARQECMDFKDEATIAAKESQGRRDDEEERRMVAEIQVKVRAMFAKDQHRGMWVALGAIKRNMPGQRWRGPELDVALYRMVEAGEVGQQVHPKVSTTTQYSLPPL